MPEIGYASLGIIPTFKGLQGDLERGSSKALAAAGVTGGEKFGTAATKAARGRFAGAAKGIVAPLVGALAAVKIGDFFRDSVAEARESQKVTALTNRVIKTTGGVAKVTAKHVGALSTKISNKTAIDDEAVQKGANLLLTFKNVRNEVGKGNKIFDQATKAAVDLSAAGFGDLAGTSKQLGKALNDPVKGITALGRAGVTFTDQQKKQIKSYVASGNALKAQKMILREVTSQVGGAAAAQATSGEKVKVAFDNIKESVGTALLPAIEDVEKAFLNKGIPALQKFVTWADKKGVPALENFGKKATPVVRDVLGKARDFLKEAQPYAEGFVEAFNKLPKGVKQGVGAAALLGFGATKIPGVKNGAGALAGGAKSLVQMVIPKKPIPVFVVNNGVPGPGGPTPTPTPGPESKLAKVAGLAAKTVASVAIMHYGDKLLQSFTSSDKGANPTQAARNVKTAHGIEPNWHLPIIGGTAKHNAVEDLKGTDASLAGMVKAGNTKTAQAQFAAITAEAKKQKISLTDLKDSFPKYYAAIATAKTKTSALAQPFDVAKVKAQHLNNEVKLIGANARGSQAEVRALLRLLDRANDKATRTQQGVSAARSGKVDRQLGGGMYVANMNVHGTSLPEVRRDAQHQHRSRAYGAESFQ